MTTTQQTPFSKGKVLVNPTVLLVEDDLNQLAQIAKHFTSNTALGVLPVNNLRDAAVYLTPRNVGRYQLQSVFADEEFSEDAHGPTLRSGLDLLKLAHKRQPKMGLYLHTVHGDDSRVLNHAAETLGSRSRVFAKGEMRQAGQEPWNCVWRDWLIDALRTDPSLQGALEHDHINALEALDKSTIGEQNMAEKLRRLFDAHRVTYLFMMGSIGKSHGLSFLKPVEVICIREGDASYTARALGLGVLKEGKDECDAWEAQVELADHIAEQYLDLKVTSKAHLGQFAARVFRNLREVINDPANN